MSQEGTQFTANPSGADPSSSAWISKLFLNAAQPKSVRKVGLEVERFALWPDLKPFLYRSEGKRIGAGDLLKTLASEFNWGGIQSPTGHLIGLNTGNGTVTLEPGSQVELSLNPSDDLHTGLKQVADFETQIGRIAGPLGLSWIGVGVNPIHPVEAIDIIPSPRYGFMTDYYNKSGRYGTSMMRLTNSIQVNLDYASEKEAIEMLRVALLVAPISYLLFSNSPFYKGVVTEFLSFRAEIWRDSDPARSGLMPELFEDGFSFDKLAQYFWNQPLMFAQDTKGEFIPALGKSLLDVSKEKNPPFPVNEKNQWNAIRELFTEARLKPGYVEVRSIDGLLPVHRAGAAAFWTGLLYGEDSRKLAIELLGGLSHKERLALWIEITRSGFKTKFQNLNLSEITSKLLKASEMTLKTRGFKEETLLSSAFEILDKRKSPGAELLENFNTKWNKNFEKVIDETRFP